MDALLCPSVAGSVVAKRNGPIIGRRAVLVGMSCAAITLYDRRSVAADFSINVEITPELLQELGNQIIRIGEAIGEGVTWIVTKGDEGVNELISRWRAHVLLEELKEARRLVVVYRVRANAAFDYDLVAYLAQPNYSNWVRFKNAVLRLLDQLNQALAVLEKFTDGLLTEEVQEIYEVLYGEMKLLEFFASSDPVLDGTPAREQLATLINAFAKLDDRLLGAIRKLEAVLSRRA